MNFKQQSFYAVLALGLCLFSGSLRAEEDGYEREADTVADQYRKPNPVERNAIDTATSVMQTQSQAMQESQLMKSAPVQKQINQKNRHQKMHQ